MIDVAALGECLIDFTPNGENAQGIALFARNPGGAPANVLAMNARLGGKTAFTARPGLATRPLGALKEAMERQGAVFRLS